MKLDKFFRDSHVNFSRFLGNDLNAKRAFAPKINSKKGDRGPGAGAPAPFPLPGLPFPFSKFPCFC